MAGDLEFLFRNMKSALGFLDTGLGTVTLMVIGFAMVIIAVVREAIPSQLNEDFEVGLDPTLFCSTIEISKETKRYKISEIFDEFEVNAFPFNANFIAFTKIRFPNKRISELEVRYSIIDENEEVIFTSEWGDLSVSVGYPMTYFAVGLKSVNFQRPGNYYVCVETKRRKKINLIGKSLLILKIKQIRINELQASDKEDSQSQ